MYYGRYVPMFRRKKLHPSSASEVILEVGEARFSETFYLSTILHDVTIHKTIILVITTAII
jgi:hypothetical protein